MSETQGQGGRQDTTEGQDNCDDNVDIADLLPQYFALCRRDLERLRTTLEQRAFTEARILGHNLKGSGGAYGFPEITQIGASIEQGAKASDEGAIGEGIDKLAAFLSSQGG